MMMSEYEVVSKATLRYLRVSPQKARLIINQIRGKRVADALPLLTFSRKRVASNIKKLLNSAVANAYHKTEVKEIDIDIDALYISQAFVSEGPTMKRFRPRARGRADTIRKRTSHITIELSAPPGSE